MDNTFQTAILPNPTSASPVSARSDSELIVTDGRNKESKTSVKILQLCVWLSTTTW
jgi:hypothetical protein